MTFKNQHLRNQQIQKEQKHLILLQEKIRKQISNIDDRINELKVEALQLSTASTDTFTQVVEEAFSDEPCTSHSIIRSTQTLNLESQQMREPQPSDINNQVLDLNIPTQGHSVVEEESDTD